MTTKGEGGQKYPKIWPRGLWMTPNWIQFAILIIALFTGDNVEVDCRVDANPRPSTIQWFKEGDERFVQNGPTLRLNGVTAANNGRYICSAINHLRTSTKGELTRTGNATISLNIKHKPGRSNITPENPKVSWWIMYVLFIQCIWCICTMRTKIGSTCGSCNFLVLENEEIIF